MNNRLVSLCLVLLVNISFLNYHAVAISWSPIVRGGAIESDDEEGDEDKDPHSVKFVTAAPLIVAAVCSDGIALIATHTSFLQEPLLLQSDETTDSNFTPSSVNANTTITTTNAENTVNTTTINITDAAVSNATLQDHANSTEPLENITLPKDIPLYFRGPLRIQSIDSVGSTIMCAGWKTDGDWLTQKCRDLAEQELARFGPAATGLEYGRYIAQEASLWMAQCAVSDQLRPVACAALLAVGGDDRSPAGYLWLIDATGAYRVRAHALGLGSAQLNQVLAFKNFTNATKEEAAQELLQTIASPFKGETDDILEQILDSKALIEAAVLDTTKQQMIRIRQSFLGSKHLSAFVPTTASFN